MHKISYCVFRLLIHEPYKWSLNLKTSVIISDVRLFFTWNTSVHSIWTFFSWVVTNLSLREDHEKLWNHTSALCSPVNSQHIFRTPFSKNTSEWLLLYCDSDKDMNLFANLFAWIFYLCVKLYEHWDVLGFVYFFNHELKDEFVFIFCSWLNK